MKKKNKKEKVNFSDEELDAPKSASKTAKRLFKQLKNQRIRLIAVGISIIIYTALNIITPYYSAVVLDSLMAAIKEGEAFLIVWDPLGRELTAITIMYVGLGIVYYFQSYMMASVAETLVLTLRRQISDKLNKLPLKFFDGTQPGEFLSRVTSDLDKVSETLQTGLLRLLTSIGTVIGSLAFMFYYSPLLTGIFLAFMLIILIGTKAISGKTLRVSSERQESIARLTAVSEEYYSGRNIIRAYNREKLSEEKFNSAADEVGRISQKADFLTNCVNPAVRAMTKISQAIILFICAYWMITGRMTFGVAQAFFQYVSLCADPLTEGAYMINSLQSALASAERTFEFLDEAEEKPSPKNPAVISRAEGNVTFEHVSFGYEEDRMLMSDISFSAKKGQKIAVVGFTGAGKTTLINLLMRFYEVNGGKITLDGVDTRDMTREGLRQNFGMVLQDAWLFGGTVAENIAYGKPEASREEIIRAAQMARADYFIRTMPKGYDTFVSNEADTLSAGQRQLLTIARVFLCNPPVLILDEATSSVDTRTEAEIGEAMRSLMSGRTSFVIAHRLSTIVDADLILYMENGNIIEQGTHKELLARGGAYASLYNSQFA